MAKKIFTSIKAKCLQFFLNLIKTNYQVMSPRREASIHPSTSDEDECTFIDSSWFDRDGMYPSIPKEFNSCSVEQNFKTSTLVGVEDSHSTWSHVDKGGNPNNPKEGNSCSVEQNFNTSTLVGVEDTQSAWSRADRLGGNPNPNHFRVRSDNAFSCVQEKGGDSRVSRASKKTLFVTDQLLQ